MNTKRLYRSGADHSAVARRLREQPGVQGLVHVYGSKGGAASIARQISRAQTRAYRPAGAFQAIVSLHDDGYAVWARYVEGLDLPPMPETMTVRVPTSGPRAGREGAWVVEVTISARCPRCGGPRGPVRETRFVRNGVRRVRDAWDNECGHRDDHKAVLAEAARLKERACRSNRVDIKGVPGGRHRAAVDLIAAAIAETPWLSGREAAQRIEQAGDRSAARTARRFMDTNVSRSVSARSVALYLMRLDTDALTAKAKRSEGGTR